jgi:hypothetical protein
MYRLIRTARSLVPAAVLVGLMSCAHAPDPHVHMTVPGLTLDTELIVQGQVDDTKTGAPIPYASVYLVDVRHENWPELSDYSARLGTANREGDVDLAATWTMSGDPGAGQILMPGFDRIGTAEGLVEAAEARCRAGAPASLALVIYGSRHERQYVFFDAAAFRPGGDGVVRLDIGQVALVPRPASDFLLYESFEEASERGETAPEGETP